MNQPIHINNNNNNNTLLSTASNLTRSELLTRRFRNLNRLSICYRDIYWIMINRLNTLHTQYLSETALSPFKDLNNDDQEDNHDTHHCAFSGCRFKPMPCTLFCLLHILSDPNQHLYKPCTYVIKSARDRDGPITCAKPIMRSILPPYCNVHMQISHNHLNDLLPQFVPQIQPKRRKIKEEEKEDDS